MNSHQWVSHADFCELSERNDKKILEIYNNISSGNTVTNTNYRRYGHGRRIINKYQLFEEDKVLVKRLYKQINSGNPICNFYPKSVGLNQFVLTNPNRQLRVFIANNNGYFSYQVQTCFTGTCISTFWEITHPEELYCILKKIEDLEMVTNDYIANREKEKKIKDISQRSIDTWLSSTLKNSGYEYYTSSDKNKMVLSVRMKNGTQLDIPVYYQRFQKIIPKLMDTIQKYEQLMEDTSMKALISNLKTRRNWIKS